MMSLRLPVRIISLFFFYMCPPTTAEFWTRVRQFLKPSPDVVHYILTHFRWLWDIVNYTYLRDVLMRLVLTGPESTVPSKVIQSELSHIECTY